MSLNCVEPAMLATRLGCCLRPPRVGLAVLLAAHKQKTGRAPRARPVATANTATLALVLDFRQLAHFVGRHAKLHIVAGFGEFPFGHFHDLATKAEKASRFETDGLDLAVGARVNALHRPQLA